MRRSFPPPLAGGGGHGRGASLPGGGHSLKNDHPTADQTLERTFHRPGPDLRPLQIAEQRDRPARILRRLADGPGRGAMAVGVAVRKVEARDVHARLHHRAQHVRRRARRPDGADDAGTPDSCHWYLCTRRVISCSASTTRRSSSSALITAPPIPRTRSRWNRSEVATVITSPTWPAWYAMRSIE